MSRQRMSQLKPWCIKWEYTTRFCLGLVTILFPLLALLFALWAGLKGFCEPFKDLWVARSMGKAIWAETATTAFKPWENDL